MNVMKRPLLALALLLGCGQSSGGPADNTGTATAGMLDADGIEVIAAQYKTLAKITLTSFPTQGHAGNPMVNIYANTVAEPSYRSLDPKGMPPAGFLMPVGSVLVKEMLDANGGPPVLTVMYKKAPGYDPPNHDWWYGRLNADGSPTDPSYVGMVGFCISCHMGAESSDFTWGVPTANK